MERIVLHDNVKAGAEIFTGIPGKYDEAPQEAGLYRFVEYARNEGGRLIHDHFEWEKRQP